MTDTRSDADTERRSYLAILEATLDMSQTKANEGSSEDLSFLLTLLTSSEHKTPEAQLAAWLNHAL
jgi:hypothetical protein